MFSIGGGVVEWFVGEGFVAIFLRYSVFSYCLGEMNWIGVSVRMIGGSRFCFLGFVCWGIDCVF